MSNSIDKIKATSQRIARLGAYLISPYGPTAKKEKGLLHMARDLVNPLVLICDLRDGRVWERDITSGHERDVFTEPKALEHLVTFERQISLAVARQLREEVLDTLVDQRMRQITKAKSRGFAADLKRAKLGRKKREQQAAHG